MTEARFRRAFLLLLVLAISAAFLALVRSFLLTILLAAIAAGLAHPLYRRLLPWAGGRRPLASVATMLIGFVVVGAPFAAVIVVVTNEAIRVAQNIRPWIEQFAAEPTALAPLIQRLPYAEHLLPYREQLLGRAGEFAQAAGSTIVGGLSTTTLSTVGLVVNFFIFLYTLFFLLIDGPAMIARIKQFVPLRPSDRDLLFEKFVSVTRATIKGTIVIGVVQGVLGGLAFWVLGIAGAAFWGAVMVVLSILPVVGGALVWVPTAVYLVLTGQFVKAAILSAFCGIIVGSIDNILRPRLVGRDTQLHELMILFSTLGGLFTFGAVGLVVGPIIAALFQTVWELFGAAYRDMLGAEGPPPASEPSTVVVGVEETRVEETLTATTAAGSPASAEPPDVRDHQQGPRGG